jgi:hypothetical protein
VAGSSVREVKATFRLVVDEKGFTKANTAIEGVKKAAEQTAGKAGIAQIGESAEKASKKAETALVAHGRFLRRLHSQYKDVGHAGGGAFEKIQEATSELLGKAGLGEASELVERFGDKLASVRMGATGFAAGIGFVAAGLALVGNETAKHAVEMDNSALRANMNLVAFQELLHGAEATGTGTETVNSALGKLGRSMYEVGLGNAEATKSFRSLGIEVKGANGKLRPTQDVLYDLADKMKAMPEGAERGALAMKVLGRGGLDAVPWLSRGSEALKHFAKGAHEAGVIVSRDTVKMAREYGLAKHEIAETLEGFGLRIGTAVLPRLLETSRGFEHLLEKIRPFVMSGIDIFTMHVGEAFNLMKMSLWPVTTAFDAFVGIMKGLQGIGSGWGGGIVEGIKAIMNPLQKVWDLIQDLQFYWAGKGSTLGFSIASARGKGREYVEGIKAGKSFDKMGDVVEQPNSLPAAPGSAGAFADTAKSRFGETAVGRSAGLAAAAERRGDWGESIAHSFGLIAMLPTVIPEAIVRGLSSLPGRFGGASAFGNPEFDWRNPENGPQVSREPRIPGYAPAGSWERPVNVAGEVKIRVEAGEGLRVEGGDHANIGAALAAVH